MSFIQAAGFGFLEKPAEASPVRPSSVPHQGRTVTRPLQEFLWAQSDYVRAVNCTLSMIIIQPLLHPIFSADLCQFILVFNTILFFFFSTSCEVNQH